VLPSVHFDTKLKRRSGSAPEPARAIGQPGVGISPKTAGTISQLVTELEQCDEYITPICLRALYGLVYEPVATELNSYGIGMFYYFQLLHGLINRTVEYTPQAYLQTDLQMFAMNYSTDLIGKEPYMVSIDGGDWLQHLSLSKIMNTFLQGTHRLSTKVSSTMESRTSISNME
jgi:tripeptidyl-peptidase-1